MAWGILHDYISRPSEGDVSREGHSEEHTRIPVEAAVLGYQSEDLPDKDDNGKALPVIDFQMFDDDGELYYAGRLHDDEECINQLNALKYGEGDAGCTTIKVNRQDGKGWVQEIG